MIVAHGFEPGESGRVAHLFWQAFSDKLSRLLGPERRAVPYLARVLRAERALVARDARGRLVGVAGVKTAQGGFVGGGLADLATIYGRAGALWRAPVLAMMDRPLAADEMLMDGLFVAPEARGAGVGSALIRAVLSEARRRGCTAVRLEVIDRNLRARALYERLGFVPTEEVRLGLLAPMFGFRQATTMRRPV